MRIIKIGKDKSNDIYINLVNDPTVSRIHCQIFLDDEGNKFLKDMGSTNGTFVNGNKIKEPYMLKEYDIVKAGNSVIDWKGYLMNQNLNTDGFDKTINEVAESEIDKKDLSISKEKINTKSKDFWTNHFTYNHEYISGSTYWLRQLLNGILVIVFFIGFYLTAITVYKRSRSLEYSHEYSVFLSIFITLFGWIPYINFLAIIFHLILWFSNGDKNKFQQKTFS